MRLNALGILVLLVSATPVSADEIADAQTKVAQIVALADLAGHTCPGLQREGEAEAAFLRHAGLSEDDLSGRFGDVVQKVGDNFAISVARDRTQTCTEIVGHLGPSGLGLLRPDP